MWSRCLAAAPIRPAICNGRPSPPGRPKTVRNGREAIERSSLPPGIRLSRRNRLVEKLDVGKDKARVPAKEPGRSLRLTVFQQFAEVEQLLDGIPRDGLYQ